MCIIFAFFCKIVSFTQKKQKKKKQEKDLSYYNTTDCVSIY